MTTINSRKIFEIIGKLPIAREFPIWHKWNVCVPDASLRYSDDSCRPVEMPMIQFEVRTFMGEHYWHLLTPVLIDDNE